LLKRIAILHYASAPTVGGVESTMTHHAHVLTQLGYQVRIISGSGGPINSVIETHFNPLFGSTHPDILAIKAKLDKGEVPPEFAPLRDHLVSALKEALADCDVCIAHNVLSLNKNLPLTAALAQFRQDTGMPLIAWCHDLAWTNEQYKPELHPGYPWDLLRTAWEGTRYVTVSETRRTELATLLGIAPDQVSAIVPGVDPALFFHWTPAMTELAVRLNLLDSDGLLIVPAQRTPRRHCITDSHHTQRQSDLSFACSCPSAISLGCACPKAPGAFIGG
jgi:hypothetical protein